MIDLDRNHRTDPQPELYPGRVAGDTLEDHLARHARAGSGMYAVVVVVVLAALAALPLVRVHVTVQADGLVRPIVEKSIVRARTSGLVETVAVRNHQRVARGEPLLTMQAVAVREEEEALSYRLGQRRAFVADLRQLARIGALEAGTTMQVATPKYREELALALSELQEAEVREAQARRELERARALRERDVVSDQTVEARASELDQIRAARSRILERARSRWQSELAEALVEERQLLARMEQTAQQRALHTVRAPMTGTIEELSSVGSGSFLPAGEMVAVISPISEMVAEVYVSPHDVGLLRVGMPARLQVDAFTSSDWGFLTGHVQEIGDDFVMLRGRPMFRVRCSLDRTWLELRNGVRGQIKKGMTLRAHFVVARRSLFQLLRDDVGDWLDPRNGARANSASAQL